MSFTVTVDTTEVQRIIDALPDTIFRAQRSAIGTTTTWAKKEIQSKLAVKTGISKRVFNRFRVKSKRLRESGVVWMGLNPVKAVYVGPLSQNADDLLDGLIDKDPDGVSAGDYYFEGGFIARMRSGHVGIFKRIGQSRLGIIEQTVDLNLGFEVAEAVAGDTARELRERFMTKVRELNPHLE